MCEDRRHAACLDMSLLAATEPDVVPSRIHGSRLRRPCEDCGTENISICFLITRFLILHKVDSNDFLATEMSRESFVPTDDQGIAEVTDNTNNHEPSSRVVLELFVLGCF